jgi:Zn-finger nucleic acid-binding protein
MMEAVVPANPGQLIVLDQCQNCGGIWCDKWELFPIDAEAAAKLDKVDTAKLHRPIVATPSRELHCPRCTAKLVAAHDPSLLADMCLRRCFKCDGIWLNRGQLTQFKAHQSAVRQNHSADLDVARRVSAVMENPKAWVVTGTQGMFAYPHGEEESLETVGESVKSAGKLIIRTLARMLVGI